MNILIVTNTNFMVPTSVMVYSLCRSHRNKEVDIYLAYHDLRVQDIERLQRIISHFEKKRLHPIDVETNLLREYQRQNDFRMRHIIVF